jgi:hypothetical protein
VLIIEVIMMINRGIEAILTHKLTNIKMLLKISKEATKEARNSVYREEDSKNRHLDCSEPKARKKYKNRCDK